LSFLKGVYVLVIQVDEDTDVDVGAMGRLTFKKGLYAYVGSAQNNLEQRVKRHLRSEKRKFWHVDYLLGGEAVKVVEVLTRHAEKAEECAIAGVIGERGEPIEGFGSSDCSCRSHLFRIGDYGFLQEFMQVLDVKKQRFSKRRHETVKAKNFLTERMKSSESSSK
jgi:Uri superfamily endonuclease